MKIENCTDVWVFIETRDGKIAQVGPELLGLAQNIAAKLKCHVAAVLFGSKVGGLVNELAAYGAEKVYLADSPALANYRHDAYASVLTALVNEHKPEVLLMGATHISGDLAATVAARLETGLSAHCSTFDTNEKNELVARIPAFGGVWASIICPERRPQMATMRPGTVRAPEKQAGRKTETVKVAVNIDEKTVRTKVVEVFTEPPKVSSLERAGTVVCGGFGIGSKGEWGKVEALASVLGGSVGATRPACDEGWAKLEEQMVGQSGRTIHPNLYIGAGISGFMHHLVGIKDSKIIVAINSDPNAPIIKASDYALIGDFKNILPALTEECRKAMEQ